MTSSDCSHFTILVILGGSSPLRAFDRSIFYKTYSFRLTYKCNFNLKYLKSLLNTHEIFGYSVINDVMVRCLLYFVILLVVINLFAMKILFMKNCFGPLCIYISSILNDNTRLHHQLFCIKILGRSFY